MQTTTYYVIEPTAVLRELAASAEQAYVAQSAVWHAQEHDRIGPEYSAQEVSRAHWMQFIANLIGDEREPATLGKLREKCLALGFDGCWRVTETKIGGDAKELMEEADAARAFLKERGVAAP